MPHRVSKIYTLNELVNVATSKSPYYRDLYRNVVTSLDSTPIELASLPIVDQNFGLRILWTIIDFLQTIQMTESFFAVAALPGRQNFQSLLGKNGIRLLRSLVMEWPQAD